MKRALYLISIGLVFSTLAPVVGGAQEQSLGDAARKARMQKPSPSPNERVFDNENLPRSGGIGYVSSSAQSKSSDNANAGDDKKSDDNQAASAEKETSKKAAEEWAGKIADQKKGIAQLERELSVLQRERQIRATVFYADAGMRLRDPQKYTQDEQHYQDETASKQKALDDARQKLDNLQEEARKANVPASVRE